MKLSKCKTLDDLKKYFIDTEDDRYYLKREDTPGEIQIEFVEKKKVCFLVESTGKGFTFGIRKETSPEFIQVFNRDLASEINDFDEDRLVELQKRKATLAERMNELGSKLADIELQISSIKARNFTPTNLPDC